MPRREDPTGFFSSGFGLFSKQAGDAMSSRKKAVKPQSDAAYKDSLRTLGGSQGKSNLRIGKGGKIETVPDKPPARKKAAAKKPMPVKKGARRGK